MKATSVFSGAVVSGAMLLAGSAGAAVLTLDPTANNGGAGVVDAGTPAFQTTGGTISLGTATSPSVLRILGNTGVANFSESGTIFIDKFTNGASNVAVGAGAYSIYGVYNINGSGSWLAPGVYLASGPTVSFSLNLFADAATGPDILLGSASLVPNPTNYAQFFAGGGVGAGDSGSANTVLAAVLAFTPTNVAYTGLGGFFQAPVPFNININVGAVGGNVGNTVYSVDAGGVVTVTTPLAGTSPSTGNLTFTQVPEPGALSLAGIALLGLAAIGRRKARKAA
jgi:hypothetical protein